MPECVGVAFKRVARSYWFDTAGLPLKEGDRVVVETTRGEEPGTVRIASRQVSEADLEAPLKAVVRRVTDADLLQEQRNRQKAKHALELCAEAVKRLELPMRLLQAEYSFDAGHLTIYFAAENRVDFRELVRDLGGQLHVRIQLHQVGARDQARMMGGIGPCGLTLCCATFLTEFAPVSMKMAKDQSLYLNPVKFSGVCGKLMCCLRYEQDTPEEAQNRLPQIGQTVTTPTGQGKVMDLNLKTETALVKLLETGEEKEFAAAELSIVKTTRCTDCRGCQVHSLISDAEEAITPEGEE